jgi:hypothetical protein
LVQSKTMDININCIIIVILYDEAFKYGDGMTFGVMLGQTLNHCDWNYVVLYNAIPC